MPNNYFQFKQFTIHQDKCAMKACTDSCLFGAYITSLPESAINVLDIGTGTGLLTLMLAQKNNSAVIDAVEIDTNAFLQAKENFERSPWNERLNILHADIATFTSGKKYDLIISNPPFFEDDLRSASEEKNNAKHDTSLTLNILLGKIEEHLSTNGKAAILLPYSRISDIEELLKAHNFFIEEKTLVKQTPKHNYFRVFLIFSKTKKSVAEKIIIIKEDDNQYSEDFTALLKDYYLHL